MQEIVIKTLEEYTSKLQFLDEVDMFRGIGDDRRFRLVPSAGRFGIAETSVQIEFEKALLRDFKRKAHLHLTHSPKNDFEWLFLAQHHGLPTRLMDWTFNPLVALFFAVENAYKEDCAVYQSVGNPIITPDLIQTWGDPFTVDRVFQIIPNLNHIRYQNQSGLFTIHPDPNSEDFSIVRTKYIIPKSVKDSIRWRLRKIGVTRSILFPDLDSLTYDILQVNRSKFEPYFTN
jgi:hypothetical protein